jgi:hypothetical protein
MKDKYLAKLKYYKIVKESIAAFAIVWKDVLGS